MPWAGESPGGQASPLCKGHASSSLALMGHRGCPGITTAPGLGGQGWSESASFLQRAAPCPGKGGLSSVLPSLLPSFLPWGEAKVIDWLLLCSHSHGCFWHCNRAKPALLKMSSSLLGGCPRDVHPARSLSRRRAGSQQGGMHAPGMPLSAPAEE